MGHGSESSSARLDGVRVEPRPELSCRLPKVEHPCALLLGAVFMLMLFAGDGQSLMARQRMVTHTVSLRVGDGFAAGTQTKPGSPRGQPAWGGSSSRYPPAAQRIASSQKLPSAEKIVDSYLKAIGGKKNIAAMRDATYEWTIQLKDQPMGLATTQLKTPSSVRLEMRFGNGQIVSAANASSAWTLGLDGKLHTLTDAEAAAARLQAILDASHLLNFKRSNVLARVVSLKADAAGAAYVVERLIRN